MGKESLNRRDFIKLVSLGLAGGYLGLKPNLSEAMMHRGGNGVINPPPGDLLLDPVEIISSSGVVADLRVQVALTNINGAAANLLTYNGFFPAPTIRVKKGDQVRLRFINSLPFTTSRNILGYTRISRTFTPTDGTYLPLEIRTMYSIILCPVRSCPGVLTHRNRKCGTKFLSSACSRSCC
jgi:FtsP/CotA-like multicopper oxidase with cupredoxin domain